jgi:hypothetical protein
VTARPAEAAWRFIAWAAISLAAWAGCREIRDRSIAADANTYVGLVLALGERDPDSIDFYAGPPERRSGAHAANLTLAQIRRAAAALLNRLHTAPPRSGESTDRQQFLERQLGALVARIDLLSGRRFTFDDESRLLFGVTAGAGDQAAVAHAREALTRALPGGGGLAQRYATFDARFLIPADRLAAVMTRAIDGCRRATLAHLGLPANEHVSVEYTRGSPWSAFTRYEGHAHSRVQINTDFQLTVDRALRLACHEGYPGHHTINTLVDSRLVGPMHRLELTIQPMFSPQSLRTEGAATFAPELAFPDEARLAFERDELFPLAGFSPADAEQYVRISGLVNELAPVQLAVAKAYLDGTLEFARAAAALEDEALMPSADATLKFLNEFRTYVVTYTTGRDRVAREVRGDTRGQIDAAGWRRYERWVTETK